MTVRLKLRVHDHNLLIRTISKYLNVLDLLFNKNNDFTRTCLDIELGRLHASCLFPFLKSEEEIQLGLDPSRLHDTESTAPRFVSTQLVAKPLPVEVLQKGVLNVIVTFHSNETDCFSELCQYSCILALGIYMENISGWSKY